MRHGHGNLPPDPEGMNDVRATLAKQALLQFIINTGTDWADSLGDLLANLMHLCDRDRELDFERSLQTARGHYAEETREETDV